MMCSHYTINFRKCNMYNFRSPCPYSGTKGVFTVKVKNLMTSPVIRIRPEETVDVAARTLTHYNIGILPVCDGAGKLCGLVTRCVASDRLPKDTKVKDVMTKQLMTVTPDVDASVAAHLMGRKQIRRLPVVENGVLCGMVSLGDLANREESVMDAADALSDITGNIAEGKMW